MSPVQSCHVSVATVVPDVVCDHNSCTWRKYARALEATSEPGGDGDGDGVCVYVCEGEGEGEGVCASA